MQRGDQSYSTVGIEARSGTGLRPASLAPEFDVVLKPLSRPELGEIRIDGAFAIGRTEPPFASYGNDIPKLLSRRHARIFRTDGLVYVVDLGSRNGTTVNGVAVGRAHCKLCDGDEICFGAALSYRVQITPRNVPVGSLTLTLTPKSDDSGLDTIVIAEFPFLVSKTDVRFAHYKGKGEHGRQLGYLSRRHASIYEKGGLPYIEDLGSSNGTFVDGRRVLEHAVPLQDGVEVALGGKFFVYEVSIVRLSGDETALRGSHKPGLEREPDVPRTSDKTRFVAAATSYLKAFWHADAPKDAVAQGGPAVAAASAKEAAIRRLPRGRALLLLSELVSLCAGGAPDRTRRRWWRAAAIAGILSALALTAYFWTSPARDLKDAVARGEYARAAALADRLLEKHPDDVELKARVTEAALKANVPAWLAKVRAGDFDAAKSVLTGMSKLSTHDADLRPLIDELDWLGNLERLVSSRGGPEAPIRIYADEDSIEHLIGRWNDDTDEHQRALVRIASYVPQFGDWYGEALSHLRRLQSGAAVYLPVIERVKANIATELARDDPDALEPVLQATAEKYPGLGGLDSVREDLAHYIEIRREARTGKSGRLFAALRKARFVTPPFAQSLRGLIETGQLPPSDLLQQYDAATQAWKDGNASEAFAGLQKMTGDPWGEEAAAELERRRSVQARFVAIQQSRNAAGFLDQLLAFRASLDAEEDVYFLRATETDLNLQKDSIIARAQDAMNRARALWQEYQSSGAIDASLRIENRISDQFRVRARLLAEASRDAQQGFLIYSQVDAAGAAQWAAIREEIESQALQQRSKLHDLSNVMEPELLKSKLALLGDPNE